MAENIVKNENVEQMFDIAKSSMTRCLSSVVKEPERDKYTRFDGKVSKLTVNGEEMIYIW